jgi:hypothetical protein
VTKLQKEKKGKKTNEGSTGNEEGEEVEEEEAKPKSKSRAAANKEKHREINRQLVEKESKPTFVLTEELSTKQKSYVKVMCADGSYSHGCSCHGCRGIINESKPRLKTKNELANEVGFGVL